MNILTHFSDLNQPVKTKCNQWSTAYSCLTPTECVLWHNWKEGDICFSADTWRYKSQCDICLKRLRSSWELRDHKNSVHFKVLAFSCGTCGKKFAYKRSLKRHSATTCGVLRQLPTEWQFLHHIRFASCKNIEWKISTFYKWVLACIEQFS